MTMTYITGTRYPSSALKQFLPDYLDWLTQRGETLLTTNKPGVDKLILQHCDQHSLPLQVVEFACDSGDNYRNRRVKPTSQQVQVQRVVSPSWQRFRHLTDKADKVVFFHAGKTKGRCHGLSTLQAFELACQRRGVVGEQLIVQRQHAAWVNETELRHAPTIGAAHVYVYARFVPGLGGERHSLGYYRVETWRKMAGIIQPGEGWRETVLPDLRSKLKATQQMLHQALLTLNDQHPERLVIHHCIPYLEKTAAIHAQLGEAVSTRLAQYPQVIWQKESQADLLQRIGKHICQGQALWHHQRRITAYKGLYQ